VPCIQPERMQVFVSPPIANCLANELPSLRLELQYASVTRILELENSHIRALEKEIAYGVLCVVNQAPSIELYA
jgi:hypothetical protein